MNAVVKDLNIPREELMKLLAADDIFYCRYLFPTTFRQASPSWHRNYWQHFNDPTKDFFAAEIYRGGAKTTLTRAGMSKRIAFGLSRNMLSIAISETMAEHSVRWLRSQVERRTLWAETFGIILGSKKTDSHLELINTTLDIRINILAKGMTSGIRGVNLDDWRPDFINCDDISNEETTGTDDQRKKNYDLFFGTIVPCLAPKSEAPTRKLVLNQTGLHEDDIVNKAHKDPSFFTVRYPKLIKDERTGKERSAWEERVSTEDCLKEKREYIARNQLHVYFREFGCQIISRETSPLAIEWLKYWETLPTDLVFYVGLDPAASKRTTAHRTACALIGHQPSSGNIYLVAYAAQQGKNPDEMWNWLVQIWRTKRPRQFGVETIAFQKFLAWYFKKQMLLTRTYFQITEVEDRRPKPDRIIQALSGLASMGQFFVHRSMADFIERFGTWTEEIDWDLGDATAQAITLVLGLAQGSDGEKPGDDDNYAEQEKDIPELVFDGGAP